MYSGTVSVRRATHSPCWPCLGSLGSPKPPAMGPQSPQSLPERHESCLQVQHGHACSWLCTPLIGTLTHRLTFCLDLLKKWSRKENTHYKKGEEYLLNFLNVLENVFSVDEGPILHSLIYIYILKISPVCQDCVHNQKQGNQLNLFRRSKGLTGRVLIIVFFKMLYNQSPQCSSHLLCRCNHVHSGMLLSTRLHAEWLPSWTSWFLNT